MPLQVIDKHIYSAVGCLYSSVYSTINRVRFKSFREELVLFFIICVSSEIDDNFLLQNLVGLLFFFPTANDTNFKQLPSLCSDKDILF